MSSVDRWVRAVGIGAALGAGSIAVGQQTTRVSVDSAGLEGDGNSEFGRLSANGRFVAFSSEATNLVPADTNHHRDVFVHDRMTGATTRVSVDSSGAQGDGATLTTPSISADGRFVAFDSNATNLVPGDTNGNADVFVHDRLTGTTTRVSVTSSGAEVFHGGFSPSISADGQVVVFTSKATKLVPSDNNGAVDVFAHDLVTGATTRVSVDSAGVEGNYGGQYGTVSADGRWVVFSSFATNLVAGDTNATWDVFVHDRQTGATTRVSVDSSGVEGDLQSSVAAISADGRFVAFNSRATNLVSGDGNGASDAFVHDLQTGTTTRVSVDSSGVEANGASGAWSISDDGRFVALDSDASNLVAGDTNGARDAFVHDRQTGTTRRVSVSSSGSQVGFGGTAPSLSADGRCVEFESSAPLLVPGDTNNREDVFVRGPYLTLEADPEDAASGASIELGSRSGAPSGPFLLAAVDVNGTPLFATVYFGSFDTFGRWITTAIVPPGLSGNAITLQSFGIVETGRMAVSNLEVITLL